MKRFLMYVKIAILFFLLTTSFHEIAADESHLYEGDSTFTDKVFTLGRVLGEGKKFYVCVPIENPENTSWDFLSDTSLVEDPVESNMSFVSFKPYIIKRYIKDQIGDTVQVVCSGGRFLALIDGIGTGDESEAAAYCCHLKPLIDPYETLNDGEFIIVFRKGSFYDGPIYKLTKSPLTDIQFPGVIKAISDSFFINWDDWFERYGPCRQSHIGYWRSEEANPDTIFVFAKCNMGMEEGHDYTADYLAYFDNNTWKIETLIVPGDGLQNHSLSFGVDINNDKTIEYICHGSELVFWYWYLFSIKNGHIQTFIQGEYPEWMSFGE